MQTAMQYDFFKEVSNEDVLKAELSALKESHDRVRKKTFAQLSELTKMYLRQQEEIEYMKVKMGLCCYIEKKE